MKAKVLIPFHDIKDGVDRVVGDVVEVTKERFDEINEKLGAALQEMHGKQTKEDKSEKANRELGKKE